MLDCKIRGGRVVDGTGAPARQADVGIRDGRIVSVGETDEVAAHTLDAAGLVVAPGFVDVHTHYDAQLLWDPAATPSSLHGVTTVVGGNCGFTLAPVDPGAAAYVMPMLARVEGMPVEALEAGLDWSWSSFGSWLDRLEGALSVNAGFLVGHSTLRRLAMGERAVGERAAPRDLERMVDDLRESLAAGGLGLSSSNGEAHNDHRGDPVPSRAADEEELLALCRAVREHPGTTLEYIPTIQAFFTPEHHARMTRMSLAGSRPLNWNLLGVASTEGSRRAVESKLQASDHARERGARVVALLLPDAMRLRLTLRTGVLYDTLPGWGETMHLPLERKREALRDPAVRARLAEGAASSRGMLWGRFAESRIVDVRAPGLRPLVGRTLGDVARERGEDPLAVLFDVALEDDLHTALQPPTTDDDEVSWKERVRLARDPRVLLGGSDAGAHLDMLSTFSCITGFLAGAVRERALLPLEEAVRLLTDAPARLYGLRARGRIAPGWHADLVLFDPERIAPRPVRIEADLPGGAWRLYGEADGIERVLVNGVEVVRGAALTGARPGAVLRSGRDTETVAL